MSRRWATGSVVVVLLLLTPACRARPVSLRAGNVPQPDTSAMAASSPAEASARSLAASLLAQVAVPPGAVLATSVPAALDRPFDASPVYLPATPNLVDLHTVWTVPDMGPMDVWAFVKSHPVAGFGAGGFGPSERDRATVYNDFWVPPFGSGPPGLAHPVVAEEIVGLPGGGSALRVDVQTVGLPARSASEAVPSPAASDLSATVSVGLLGATIPPAATVVTDTAVVTMLADAFNTMPPWSPGVVAPQCDQGGATWSVTFTTTSPAASTVAATENTCWQVTVRIDGHAAQDLWDNAGALRGLIEQARARP